MLYPCWVHGSMVVPRFPHGGSAVSPWWLPWCPYGTLMVCQWCVRGGSIGVQCCACIVDVFMALSWCFRGVAMVASVVPWWVHGGCTMGACCSRGVPTVCPWCLEGASVVASWCIHGASVVLPWCPYGDVRGAVVDHGRSMLGPRWVQGAFVVPPWWLPSCPHSACMVGVSMVLPWCFCRVPTVRLWCFYGASVASPLYVRGASVVLPWCCRGAAVVSPWWRPWCFGGSMVLPCCPHGVPMVIPWCSRGGSMVVPRWVRGVSILLPWCPHGGFHGASVVGSWWVYGASVVCSL